VDNIIKEVKELFEIAIDAGNTLVYFILALFGLLLCLVVAVILQYASVILEVVVGVLLVGYFAYRITEAAREYKRGKKDVKK
jgi:hypothetical protein